MIRKDGEEKCRVLLRQGMEKWKETKGTNDTLQRFNEAKVTCESENDVQPIETIPLCQSLLKTNLEYFLFNWKIADLFRIEGKFREAIELYTCILESNNPQMSPDLNIQLWWCISWSYLMLGEKSNSERVYSECVYPNLSKWECSYEIRNQNVCILYPKTAANVQMGEILGETNVLFYIERKMFYSPEDVNTLIELMKNPDNVGDLCMLYLAWVSVCFTNEVYPI
jgi:tetratricopeptide (TPR) repeat protein